MPAPIVGGLITYLSDRLNVVVWDGEVPRQNTDGSDIVPDAVLGWPAIKVEMEESGLDRERTFEDAYLDSGKLTIICWALTREALEGTVENGGADGLLTRIEQLLNVEQNYTAIPLGNAPNGDLYYVVDLDLTNWTCVQEKEVRAQLSQLLYRGEWRTQLKIHGMMPSRAT